MQNNTFLMVRSDIIYVVLECNGINDKVFHLTYKGHSHAKEMKNK